MPYSLHYPIAAVLLTIYGLRVCPFIGTLSPLLWSAEILAVTALAALLRPLLHKSIIAPKPLPEQPTAQALLDGALFLAMSVALGLINFVLHDFPLGSAGKIASGMALMGFLQPLTRACACTTGCLPPSPIMPQLQTVATPSLCPSALPSLLALASC